MKGGKGRGRGRGRGGGEEERWKESNVLTNVHVILHRLHPADTVELIPL